MTNETHDQNKQADQARQVVATQAGATGKTDQAEVTAKAAQTAPVAQAAPAAQDAQADPTAQVAQAAQIGQARQTAQSASAIQSTDRDDFHPSHYPLLTFPDEAWQWFIDACADLEIPVDDSRRAIVEAIYSHLVGVNAWLNLTRITAPADYLKFHVFDSLTVLNLVAAFTQPGDTIVDLGSGGGYPGLPLMTWLPERHWVLVDSRAKKAAFLKEAVKLTPCVTAEAFAFRGREAASACPALHHRCQIVVARAVGQADELLIDAEALLDLNGVLILLKGQSYAGDEQHRFHHALGRHGFSLMEEQTIALDETDPDRWVVTAIKSEQRPHSTTKAKNKPKRQSKNR